jgi:hypothetical protein
VSTISAEPAGKRIEGPPIDRLEVAAYTIPTDQPESDGTFAWNSTTMIVVTLGASQTGGLGYSYTDAAAGVIALRTRQIRTRDSVDRASTKRRRFEACERYEMCCARGRDLTVVSREE